MIGGVTPTRRVDDYSIEELKALMEQTPMDSLSRIPEKMSNKSGLYADRSMNLQKPFDPERQALSALRKAR